MLKSIHIRHTMIKTRFMFDVAFDISKIKTHTRFQIKSQQKQLQKNQKVWKNQIFQYFWRLKRFEIIKINEIFFSNFEYRLTRSLDVLLKNYCRFQIWIKRRVWNEYAHCKWKKHYLFFFIVVRINDEKKIRLHMKKKIIKHNNRFFFKSLTKYVCNAMQKKIKIWFFTQHFNSRKSSICKRYQTNEKNEWKNKCENNKNKKKHSIWSDESNDFDESNDIYIIDESIDFDNRFDDDEKMQWNELIELKIETDEHKWKQKRKFYSNMSWSI